MLARRGSGPVGKRSCTAGVAIGRGGIVELARGAIGASGAAVDHGLARRANGTYSGLIMGSVLASGAEDAVALAWKSRKLAWWACFARLDAIAGFAELTSGASEAD